MTALDQLAGKIKHNDFTLGIIGIGRIGLPLALVFARAGIKVTGFDLDKEYISEIKSGKAPFQEEGLEALLSNPKFEAVAIEGSEARMASCDVFIICVGTPLTANHHVDYNQLFSALSLITRSSLLGKFVIIRSTVPPGTMLERVIPFVESRTGLKAGTDFGAASCPERVLEGHAIEEIVSLPEIIGGIDPVSTEIAASIFSKLNHNKKILRTTPGSAEMAKLFANMYRYVNFALANEFALMAEEFGQNGAEIISVVNDGYPRGGIPRPGLVGGPCLTKDGYFLVSNTCFPDLILLAARINEFMPQHVVNRLRMEMAARGRHLNNARVGLLGTSFKAGSDDERYSPSIKIAELLESEHVAVVRHDPHVKGTESLEKAVRDADVIILATNHKEFEGILPKIQQIRGKKGRCLIFDCWGLFDGQEARSHGFDYLKLGSKPLQA